MKPFIIFLEIFVILLNIYCFSFTSKSPAATLDAKGLSYEIVEESDKSKKVKITLSGTDYGTGKHCLMMKEDSDLSKYLDINSCTGTASGAGDNKCVIPCSSANNKLAYNILSPRNRYIYVFAANSDTNAAAGTTNGDIFGFEIPLIVNPQITISTSNQQKLNLNTKTCSKVKCPVKYKSVIYNEGVPGSDCATGSDIDVEFDVMIPYYEMQCEKYPSFYYHMPNAYMKAYIDVFKPQYYVTFKSTNEKTKYNIKFTNNFSTEICRFGIKDIAPAQPSSYSYVCGGEGKECYAPCNDVQLTFTPSKVLVDISIQTRYHNIKTTIESYDGYKETKFAIIEPDGGLLKDYKSTGVTLNASPYKPNETPKFNTCEIRHFPADKPRSTARGEPRSKCATSTNCESDCRNSLTIEGLTENKPIMIEIASTGIDNPTNFNEYVFLWTSKLNYLTDANSGLYVDPKENTVFGDSKITVTETTAEIKALAGTEDDTKGQVTCSYYISLTRKNAFIDAQCSDSTPCRGHCKEAKTIINLIPGSTYDIKVIAHKDYAPKIYSGVKTNLATLTLKSTFLDKGFKVVGSLSTPDSDAMCSYKLQRNDQTFKEVLVCPSPPSNPMPSIISKLDIYEKAGDNRESSSSLSKMNHLSTVYEMNVARSGSTGSSQSQTSTSTAIVFPPCPQPSLCSNIVINDGYEAEKEYKMLVKAVDRSEEVTIAIPKNPILSKNQDATKKIDVVISRIGNTLKVKTTMPQNAGENPLCKWQLINWGDIAKPIVKKCVVAGEDCKTLPLCNDISITEVRENIDYYLRVIHNTDDTIFGSDHIKIGETSSSKSTSNNTIIIATVIPVAVIIVGIGSYFGYMKNKR